MNIKLSYDSDLYYFTKLFPNDTVSVFDTRTDKDDEVDLLIFPGGEDVGFNLYPESAQLKQELSKICYFNKIRDTKEKRIFDLFMNKELKVKKVLGICRGIQFINVMFEGTLYIDLKYYGLEHKEFHLLHHRYPTSLKFFMTVNSLHHQAVKNIGKYYNGMEIKTAYLASDNSGYVPEIISWNNEQILGLQFHPEYYSECEDKSRFRLFIKSWIEGAHIINKDG